MAEINFAHESPRKEATNATPSGSQISETDTAFRTKTFSHEGADAASQGAWCVSPTLFVLSIFGGTPNPLDAHLEAIGLDMNTRHFLEAGNVLQPPESGMENSADELAERVGFEPTVRFQGY